jgi:predicted peptidase
MDNQRNNAVSFALGSIALSVLLFTGCASNKANNAPASATARGAVSSAWNSAWGGADKSYDTTLAEMQKDIAPQFQILNYKDTSTGMDMDYALYLPENYNTDTQYPLVIFQGDGSTEGKGPLSPLMQGWGAMVWASPENQAKNPCIVLAPAYPANGEDAYIAKNGGIPIAEADNYNNGLGGEVSPSTDVAFRLMQYIASTYSVDSSKIYITGQSAGCMRALYLVAQHPDFFTAEIFVSGQWPIDQLAAIANEKFFYIASEADPRAPSGMKEVQTMLDADGIKWGVTTFPANISQDEQDADITKELAEGNNINFVYFTKATVYPSNLANGKAPDFFEHMYAFDHAYMLNAVRDWLFAQSK